MVKGVLRFFFEYGAGGCLWAGDNNTRDKLGYGPADALMTGDGENLSQPPKLTLSRDFHRLRDQLDQQHSSYLNSLYPPDPSFWSQNLCDRFNSDVDKLLTMLKEELGQDYFIVDEQDRYVEDPRLDEYLKMNSGTFKMSQFGPSTIK